MNYAQIRKYDTANGIGIRSVLFVSGCNLHCQSCFNKEYQDFNYGSKWTKEVEDKFIEYINDSNVKGVSILGGEPMQQRSDTMLQLVKRISQETNKSIWMWTGLLFEHIIQDKEKLEVLKYIDVLVDGRFIESQKDITLRFRGSKNQRIINVQESLKQGKIIQYQID